MCRTANGYDINGFGQLKDGRGNICPVTIIMPTLAMEVKEALEIPDNDGMTQNEKESNLVSNFMLLLDEKIHEAKDMLIERFDWICSQSPDSRRRHSFRIKTWNSCDWTIRISRNITNSY